jgi:hypothetical protein
MTRAEHLQWAKDRALAYLAPPQVVAVEGDRDARYHVTADGRRHSHWPPAVTSKQLADACASFLSDITKHPEIDPTAANMVFAFEAWSGGMNTVEKVKHFINGTN